MPGFRCGISNTPTSEQVQKLESEDVKDAPADGIYVHGLYLEGASWSKKESHLVEAARGELVRCRHARTRTRARQPLSVS